MALDPKDLSKHQVSDLPAPSPLSMLVLRQLLLRLQKIFNISMYYARSAPPPTVWVPVFPLLYATLARLII